MSEIVLDFETASLADLSKVGADIYSKHITTDILSLTWAKDASAETHTWVPDEDMVDWWWVDAELRALAADPNHIWICHNASFEKAIWRNIMVPLFGFPDIPNDRWHDTMASCALRTWPLSLDNALHTAGLPGKDLAASRLTRALSKPDKSGHLDRSPESLARVYAYNRDDVVKERGLHKVIGYLPPMERKVWLIDQEINERGVKFDIPMVRGALKIYEAARVPLINEFRQLTGVNPTQCAKFKDWLSFAGVDMANMRKETVNALLGLADEGDDEDEDQAGLRGVSVDTLPAVVRRALTIRSIVGHASVKKFARMEQCADPIDGRIRRLLQYHGAGTGRWAGRLFNAHNMPRGLARVDDGSGKAVPPDPELLAAAITTGMVSEVDALGCFIEHGGNRVTANPIEVLASALRNTILADKGNFLLVGDWSAIEARLVLSIAGQHDKTALMAGGADVYLSMAEQIFGVKGLTKADIEKRQTGKNTILGCGFQMGAATFHSRYCSDQPMEFAERAIEAYRKEWAPEVPKLWKALQNAALLAASRPGPADSGYGIVYQVKGDWLVGECMDGSQLYYFKPTRCWGDVPWDRGNKTYPRWRYQVSPGAKVNMFDLGAGGASGNWVIAYGGLLTENFVQHMARQLLCRALSMCKDNGLPVILHNQDEIIVEHTNPDVAALKQIMEDRPRWAVNIQLPLAAECHPPCTRYHK